VLVSPATVDLLLSLLAIAAAIGLSLYAALGLPGLASYLGLLDLPGPLVGLAAPYVWGTLLALALLELLISRSRLTDLLWNALHTLARPLAATIFLSAALTGGPHTAQWVAGLTGLGIALLVHMAVLAVHTAARTRSPPPQAPYWSSRPYPGRPVSGVPRASCLWPSTPPSAGPDAPATGRSGRESWASRCSRK
jgi:hypothetical protein